MPPAPPNRLMSQPKAAPAKPILPAPKPLHNELWSVRSLAQTHLDAIGNSNKPILLQAQEARLLLRTLISLIVGGQHKIEEAKTAAKTGMLQAMKGVTDRLTATPEE